MTALNSHLQPFCFLELSKELRLIVYEFLPIQSLHHKITSTRKGSRLPSITIIRKAMPVQILATCRLIHHEAKALVIRRLPHLVRDIPRIIVEYGAAHLFQSDQTMIHAFFKWFMALHSDPTTKFEEWIEEQEYLVSTHLAGQSYSEDAYEQLKFIRNAGYMLLTQTQLWGSMRVPEGVSKDDFAIVGRVYVAVRLYANPDNPAGVTSPEFSAYAFDTLQKALVSNPGGNAMIPHNYRGVLERIEVSPVRVPEFGYAQPSGPSKVYVATLYILSNEVERRRHEGWSPSHWISENAIVTEGWD